MSIQLNQKAVLYCRVSSEEQVRKGYSLDTQEKYCREFAKRNGYAVIGVFRDEGKSATTLNRPSLKDLLAKVQQDKSVDSVIVLETDRLARNTADHLAIKALLQKAEVKLISVAQPMLDDSPEGNMVDTILASVNQFQSDINSRKTKKGLQERFETGWWPGWAPLGYLNKKVNEKLVVIEDPEKFHLLREGFKMYLTGNYSAIEISDILYKKGLRSKTGKKVCNSVMTYLLQNSFYAGIMRWGGQERKGRHKPMITLAEHRRILQIMDAHNLHVSRRRKHRFLLIGFAFCNICEGRYTAEKHPSKNNITYYHCAFWGKKGRERPHTNVGQNIKADALEEQVNDKFQEIQFNDEFIDLVVRRLKFHYRRQKQDTETQKRLLFNQKMAAEHKRDIAEEKLLSGVISDTDFKRIRDKISKQLFDIQNQLDEIENQHTYDVDLIKEVLKLTRNIYLTYLDAPYELQRQYLALFWEKFMVRDREIKTAIPSPFFNALIEDKKVIISSSWLPSPKFLIILKDRQYMVTLREQLDRIKSVYKNLKSP